MPQRNQDLNDQLQKGTLPSDGAQKVVPITAAARQAQEDAARVKTVKQLLSGASERAKASAPRESCTAAHHWIDQSTGGMRPKFVWLLGADTNWGKSSYLIAIADENIRAGRRVLIVSGEDSDELYGDRLMCRRARVSAHRLRERKLTSEEWQKVSEVGATAEDAPVYLSAIGKPIEWAGKQARALIRSEGIKLVAFDYIQAFDNERPQNDRRAQINYIGRVMMDVAKEEGVAGLILSQITVGENKKHPDKHSIRESRDLSNMAEVVALGFTTEKAIDSQRGNRLAEVGDRCLFLDKVKDGAAKRVFALKWDQQSACFDRVEHRLGPVAEEYDDMFDDFDTPTEDDRRYP